MAGKLTALGVKALVKPGRHSDGDGLQDWKEFLAGTDPLNPSSYGDGILDALAYFSGLPAPTAGTNPFAAAASLNAGSNALDFYSSNTAGAPNSGAPVITLSVPPGVALLP